MLWSHRKSTTKLWQLTDSSVSSWKRGTHELKSKPTIFNIMVLISTWLEWSGITFRNVDAKLGTQQRFHQQKESIQEDSRWVLLFKDFGWVCLVTTQFQVSDLWGCQCVKRHKSTFFCLPADTKPLHRRYHNGLKVCHHLVIFTSLTATVSYHFPKQCKQPTHQSLLRSTRSATVRYPPRCKLT